MTSSPPARPADAALLRDATELGRHVDYNAWAHALTTADLIADPVHSGNPDAVRALLDLVAGRSGLDPATVRRRVDAVQWLHQFGLDRIAEQRTLPIGVVCRVSLHRHLSDDTKVHLLEEFVAAAVADPGLPVRALMEARLRELELADGPRELWRRDGDDWRFNAYDPRLGRSRQPFRLAGQAALNLVERFRPEGGLVVSACCGAGTVMDACALRGVERYVGFDLRCDERVAERHAPRFRQFDATRTDWTPVCAAGAAGLVVVTPPPFTFGRSAETDEPTDLGRFVDPTEWLVGIEHVIVGATSALAVGGVIAVTVRQTAEFEHGAPVPDLRFEVGRLLAEAGFEMFLGNPVVTVGRAKRAEHSGAWLVPEVVQIVLMRKS